MIMQEIKTQRERMEHSKAEFNRVLLENSSTDDLYQAILEWEFAFSLDLYGYYDQDYLEDIHEIISQNGRPDLSDKLVINVSSVPEVRGYCICGKHNLRSVYYIKNKYNDTVLPTGRECIKKTFKDGSILENIDFIDKCLNKYKDYYKKKFKKLEKQYKNLEEQYNILKKKFEDAGFTQQLLFDNIRKQYHNYRK